MRVMRRQVVRVSEGEEEERVSPITGICSCLTYTHSEPEGVVNVVYIQVATYVEADKRIDR